VAETAKAAAVSGECFESWQELIVSQVTVMVAVVNMAFILTLVVFALVDTGRNIDLYFYEGAPLIPNILNA
jgi:hypothetical protein